MTKIILASENKIKEEAVKQWFKKNIKKDLDSIKKVDVSDILLPPQPINTGGILNCSDRIKFVEKNIKDIEDYDFIISIENSLNITDEKIVDSVHIIIKDLLLNCEYSAFGGNVELTYNHLKEYPKLLNITEDLIKNYEETNDKYIYDGCKMSLGELIHKYYPNIPAKNWMKKICNMDRKDQILSVLKKLTPKIK